MAHIHLAPSLQRTMKDSLDMKRAVRNTLIPNKADLPAVTVNYIPPESLEHLSALAVDNFRTLAVNRFLDLSAPFVHTLPVHLRTPPRSAVAASRAVAAPDCSLVRRRMKSCRRENLLAVVFGWNQVKKCRNCSVEAVFADLPLGRFANLGTVPTQVQLYVRARSQIYIFEIFVQARLSVPKG